MNLRAESIKVRKEILVSDVSSTLYIDVKGHSEKDAGTNATTRDESEETEVKKMQEEDLGTEAGLLW